MAQTDLFHSPLNLNTITRPTFKKSVSLECFFFSCVFLTSIPMSNSS